MTQTKRSGDTNRFVPALTAYGLIESGISRELESGYLVLNIRGSLLRGFMAIVERQAGFILLEFCMVWVDGDRVVRAWKVRRLPRAAV